MSADARSVVQRGGQASYATTKAAVQTPGRVMQVAERGERRVSNGSAGAEVREAVLAALTGFNRQMMARLGGASAMEWPRGVSAGQIKLLFWLTHADEQPMSQIARALGIGTPGATSLVDKLVEHSLVTREHSPADRRVVLVRATDEGHALATRLRQISESEWRRVLAYVPDESLPVLREGIGVLARAIQQASQDAGVPFCPVPPEGESVAATGADTSAATGGR